MAVFNFIKNLVIVILLFPIFTFVMPLGIPAYLTLILIGFFFKLVSLVRNNMRSMSNKWKTVSGK